MRTSFLQARRSGATIMLMCMFLPCAGIVSSAEPVEINSEELMRTLSEADASFMQALTASIEVTEPSSPLRPEHGTVTRTGTLACLGQSASLILEEVRFERSVAYEEHGAGPYDRGEYDAEGNLIVWRPGELFYLRDPDFIYAYEVMSSQRIAPDNTLFSTHPSHQLRKFAASDRRGSMLWNRVILATGRGFAQYLRTVKSARSLPSGLIEVVADGSYGVLNGTWTITVDPAAGHMVRSASCLLSGWDDPFLRVSATGTQAGEFPLQGEVTIRLSEGPHFMTTTVEFSDPKKDSPEGVIARARAKVMGELPAETGVFDYRRGALERYSIGEESPEPD